MTTDAIKNALSVLEPKIDNKFPRNIVAVCEKLGIKVSETKDFPSNVSGLIYKKDHSYCILINSNQSAGRKSFTIAHELGHYMLHKEKLEQENEIISGAKGIDIESPTSSIARQDITSDTSQEYRKLETEANKFAAELLMPSDVFLTKCIELNSIDDVANFFGVSISAATIRADRLGGLYFL